ncbi:MAG: type II toxin-antitoxin system HicA family toxin [Deltaproteobacteria bacterium]|nr:type II toxin-antitoxin system HicA family toxin [Deltaproteobacteria bacterium]
MSSSFPPIKPKQIVKILERQGFILRRVSGSHHIFRHPHTKVMVPVPIHGNKDLKKGTLRNILKQAGLSIHDLLTLLKET